MNRSKGTAHELGLGQDVGISVARREECSHRASHMCEQYEQLLTKLTTMSSLSPGWDVYIGLRRPEACSYMSYMFNMSNMFNMYLSRDLPPWVLGPCGPLVSWRRLSGSLATSLGPGSPKGQVVTSSRRYTRTGLTRGN